MEGRGEWKGYRLGDVGYQKGSEILVKMPVAEEGEMKKKKKMGGKGEQSKAKQVKKVLFKFGKQ
ncbi:hypothetical protein Patl1_26151 [Pistacia atlantica]|uniref:Uncharacterized protein n=1 Tax=Pistacia atlantica TaxID=434234 RepID=A0ACC1B4B1_9ROSI|nr:hypothetical protein Patl1_26151 [Pistacia atlantica]